MKLPEWFDSSRLKLALETFDGMLSLDDKNYVIFDNGKLIKHGSGLKGRHLPALCDRFIEDLCWAVFNGVHPSKVYQDYVDLSDVPSSEFFFSVTLGKREYSKTSMYHKIAKMADVSASLYLIKTREGYLLEGEPDHDYYKKRLADIAERITSQKAKTVRRFLMGQTTMEAF